jgi:hypothetical protein
MTTDKQRRDAAIDCLNNARDLLESSSDEAQHAIAEELGSLVMELESLKFFFNRSLRPLAYSFSFDADRLDGKQWIVTEEFRAGYSVIGEFPTRDAAVDYVQTISNGGRR